MILLVICTVSLISSIHCQHPLFLQSALTETAKKTGLSDCNHCENHCFIFTDHRLSMHGTNKTANSIAFTCSMNGAITGIKYRATHDIKQMEFVCSSAERIRTFGPYGDPKGTEGEVHCEPGQYISSFKGRAYESMKGLSIRCRDANTLKGEGTLLSKGVETEGSGGFEFDDLAYSNGARPVGMRMWITDIINAIQIDYSNVPVELCTDKCDEYKEENSELRGTKSGTLAVFSCADQGVITAVKIRYKVNVIYSLTFTCESGVGKTVGERIGGNEGKTATFSCPPGTFVGSFHGRHVSWITAFGIRCVEFNETGAVPKFDSVGGISGDYFDDAPFSERGWRPVELQIYHDSDINGIIVKYGNLPVASGCKVNRIEIADKSAEAKSDGFEVIGVSSASTCQTGQRLLKLDYSRDLTEEVGIDTSDGGDVNWADEISVSSTLGVNLFGVNAEVSLGLSKSQGGSKSWSTTSSNSSATTTGAASGQDVYYDAPGACIIIGYVDRYTFDNDNVEAKYHFTCRVGELDPRLTNIKIQSKTYGKAYFEDFQFAYESQEQCTQESQDCVKTLDANKILADPVAFKKAFFNCRPSSSGKITNTSADFMRTAATKITEAAFGKLLSTTKKP